MDHPKEEQNKREFKRYIIGGILDLLQRSPLKQEKHRISGPQMNIIASILELLKTLSEVIEKSNYGIPLDLRKRYPKIKENFVRDPQLNMI